MVICKPFVEGSCQNGSKCPNEHINVRAIIKNDLTEMINGNMWPLTAYSPFKGKANLPNFVEDHSFEEMRFQCYVSKSLDSLDHFHMDFNNKVNQAWNKIKYTKTVNSKVLRAAIEVHDTPPSYALLGQQQVAPASVMWSEQMSAAEPSAFSRIEDLTPEEIEAYQGDYFLPGMLPFNPPAREFCFN